jgi:hypothetical protein
MAYEVRDIEPSRSFYATIINHARILIQACTAVVTGISYHNKRTIEDDVSFLSEAEWREEIKVLLDDLIDEDGSVKRVNDLRTDAGMAWSKLYAVYPSITQGKLSKLTAEQIIAGGPCMCHMSLLRVIGQGVDVRLYA